MNKIYTQWKKQLDDFDAAVDALASLDRGVRVWGALAPALPAIFDALMRERASYKETSDELRRWMAEHDKETGDPEEFGKHLLATIEASRRVKGLIDAYNREKEVAEAAYPEMAGGSLKDTAVAPLAAPQVAAPDPPKRADAPPNGQDTAARAPVAPTDASRNGERAGHPAVPANQTRS